MTDSICPSCGHPNISNDKPLCFFCFYRGNVGTMKMIILDIFNTSISEKLLLEDIQDRLNDFEYIGYPMSRSDIKKLLTHYTKLGLLTSSKERKKSIGRPKLYRKITKKGQRLLTYYKSRWNKGIPIIKRGHCKKPRKNTKRFSYGTDYIERSASIRGKIGKEYPIYKFIFPSRNMKKSP